MENEIVKKESKKKLLENKYTYLVFILVVSFLLNLLGGEISISSIVGTIIGSLIFAYPIYYIYQAVRYRRWNVGDKQVFEIGVLRVASILTLLVCISALRVILN
jgi:amino acid permease